MPKKPAVFGLVDCNNFYVSCERVFNPKLKDIPVVVLSNNDGCVVARSDEVKNAGVPMGVPYFQVKDKLTGLKAKVLSSNYALYGDMSRRVMQVLMDFSQEIEFYSIDEAFLGLPALDLGQGKELGIKIKQAVWLATGIPVTVGFGPTKTLTKVASEIAKKDNRNDKLLDGTFDFTDCPNPDLWLHEVDVKDVWGVGRKYSKFLKGQNIFTALQLKNTQDHWIKANLKIPGLLMVRELRGQQCFNLNTEYESRKGIISSRSFGRSVYKLDELKEAVSNYVGRAAEKLRSDGTLASYMQVFTVSDPEKNQASYYKYDLLGSLLPGPTDYTPEILAVAFKVLEKLYKSGKKYKKAGVFLGGITSKANSMSDLFDLVTPQETKRDAAMAVLDKLRSRYGAEALTLASSGRTHPWQMKNAFRSNRFTTVWKEILKVRV